MSGQDVDFLVRGPLREQDAAFGDPRLPLRFWVKVNPIKSGCWEWMGAGISRGYGRFHLERRDQLAHRVSYESLVGEVADGWHLDHLCRNRACVRPSHLEAVTPSENTRRGESPLRSRNGETCRNGIHPWPASAEETPTQLHCGECARARRRKWARANPKPLRVCVICGASVTQLGRHQASRQCQESAQ